MDVDDLTPQDLDQLSNLIANALQVVDQDQRLNPRPNQAGPGPRNLQSEQQEEEESKEEMTDTSTDEEKEKVLKNDPTLKPQGIFPIEPASLQGNSLTASFSCFRRQHLMLTFDLSSWNLT